MKECREEGRLKSRAAKRQGSSRKKAEGQVGSKGGQLERRAAEEDGVSRGWTLRGGAIEGEGDSRKRRLNKKTT